MPISEEWILIKNDVERTDMNRPGWVFKYETPLNELPFTFHWASEEEKLQEEVRRPDCIAYNLQEKRIILMEFTRAMDRPHTMQQALTVKSTQYAAATRALRKGQRTFAVRTSPYIFGALGSVLTAPALEQLNVFKLTPSKAAEVLAAGCRAAITGASNMATARFASIKQQRTQMRARKGKRRNPRRALNFGSGPANPQTVLDLTT